MSDAEIDGLLPDGRLTATDIGGRRIRLWGDALPGERVVWDAGQKAGKRAHGRIVEVTARHPQRVFPSCDWVGACGGCDLAAWPTAIRRDALLANVASLLNLSTPPEWHESPQQDGYRARISMRISNGRLGYHRPRSHEVVEVEQCAVAQEAINKGLRLLRAWLGRHDGLTHALQQVELRTDGQVVVYAFRAASGRRPSDVQPFQELGNVAIDGRRVCGDTTLYLEGRLEGVRASAGSFYQVNPLVNAMLVAHAVRALRDQTSILELYAGNGNFSVPLARQGIRVTAVELEGSSIRDLRGVVRASGLPIQVYGANVGRFDPSRVAYDGVLLDPPRSGASGVLPRVSRQRPERIVYVSCNPVTLARDLRGLKGYRLASVDCFDMFPQTHHVETAAVLIRGHPRDTPLPMR